MKRFRTTAFFICALLSSSVAAPSGALASSTPDQIVLGVDPTASYDFEDWISGPSLADNRYWILTGMRLANGACRYHYSEPETTLPATGWEVRSVAIDMKQCAKLMEEGTPTTRPSAPSPTISSHQPGGAAALASTAYYAWQQVAWKDVIGLVVNYDVTQIGWVSDGSTVTGGAVSPFFYGNGFTGWHLVSYQVKHTYPANHSSYMGNTISTFVNTTFCFPLPTVWTYYYYNKVWGFPDGHATRSQNSDSVDECLPLHFDIYSAYGQFQP